MGALWSVWGQKEDPDFDVPDPETSLTPRDRKHVVDTWRIIQENVKENGVALFINYFEAYPEAQTKFPSFKGVDLDDLRSSKVLQAHASGVMYTLTCVVDNLGDPECLKEMLKKLGENHGRRLVTRQHFQDLRGIIMDLLQDKLGHLLTPEVRTSWEKTIDVLYEGIFTGLDAKT